WKDYKAVQHDQGRLCDRQAQRQGKGKVRIARQSQAFCAGRPTRSSQRIPQTARTSYQAEEEAPGLTGKRSSPVRRKAASVGGNREIPRLRPGRLSQRQRLLMKPKASQSVSIGILR